MRQSEKLIIICGTILLLLAAFFSISVMMQFLDFGVDAPGKSTIFFALGSSLYQAYGKTSIFIPVFLFVAAILMFLPTFSIRRAIYLGASILPFFTFVIAEKICTRITANDVGIALAMKSFAVIIASILLVVIEYITFGIAIDAIIAIKKPRPINTNNVDFFDDNENLVTKKENKDVYENIEDPLDALKDVSFIDNLEEDFNALAEESQHCDDEFVSNSEENQQVEEIIDENAKTIDLSEDESTDIVNTDIIASQNIEDTSTSPQIEEIVDDITTTTDDNADCIQENIDIYDSMEEDSLEDEVFSEKNITTEEAFEEEAFEEEAFEEEDLAESSKEEEDVPTEDQPIIMDFSLPPVDILGEERTIVNDEKYEVSDENAVDFDDLYSYEEAEFIENPFNSKNEKPEMSVNDQKKYRSGPYSIPTEGLLQVYPDGEYWVIDEETKEAAEQLKETLNEFKIEADVIGIRKGPVITMFEILPAPGVKLSKIVTLADNIALRLAASSVRIVAPIPGKRAVGIEVPNAQRSIVSFKEIIDKDLPEFKKMNIPVVLGKDITGEAQLLDLAKTPHLLIAGSTGSGKSVCVNSLILSILYKRSPHEVKMILIDPKVVELKLYNDIPHLLTPVITEPKRAFQSLQYCLCEMERRYALLDGMGVRDINSYNKRIVERNIATEKLPYIVVIIDEFADLMATTGKELENTLARLAAMSRAVGIHLVLATQRPSIDVITGLIKANIPTRIAFMVASKMDSRIIIDQVGAEKLLGRGDMLYASAVDPFPVRIQGTFVSDTEVENVVEYVKQFGEPEYIDEEIFVDEDDNELAPSLFTDGEDPLYEKALEIVMQAGKASASYIQRRLKIGYNRAARLVEEMEARGIVGPANGSKPREVLHVV